MRQIAWICGSLVAAAGLGYAALLAAGDPIVLWTDALVFLLVAVIAGYFAYVRLHEHLAVPWRRVAQSGSGMAALVVLLALIAIGLVDSLHFRPAMQGSDRQGKAVYAVEVRSALDLALAPLRSRPEKTYSAPFATRAYAKELVELPDGSQVREFPRLKWGGVHLKNESERESDIFLTALRALAVAFVAWWALTGLLLLFLAGRWRKSPAAVWSVVWRGESVVAWRAGLLALLALLLVAAPLAALSTQYHVFGTDKVGQDVLYLALKSIRTGLVIGTLTTLVMMPFAVLLGVMAGYFRGWIDDVIQYAYTTLNSIPGVLLIAAAVLMMQVVIDKHSELFPTASQRADIRLLVLCVILGLTSWTGLARLLRGEALKLRELEFIQAAQAFGVRDARIITRHILPNVMHIVLITLVMDFSGLVLAEAVLSYVGVGVDPSMISFGTMINAARLEMAREPMVWWALAAAFVFMFALVLSANLVRRRGPRRVRSQDPHRRGREQGRKPPEKNRSGHSQSDERRAASGGRAEDGAARHRRAGPRSRRHRPRDRARRDLCHRRRIRLRQIHDRAVADAAAARDRADRLRQRRSWRYRPARAPGGGHAHRSGPARGDDLSGAGDQPQPGDDRRAADRRGARAPHAVARARGRSARDRADRFGRHSGCGAARGRLPVPAFGRAQAAGHDRHGARRRAGSAHRR